MMDDVRDWLGLTLVPGVPLGVQHTLLDALGTPRDIAHADPAIIESLAGAEVARALAKGPDPALVEKTLAWIQRPQCRILTKVSSEYPAALLNVHSAPLVLYAEGRIELLNGPSFAIVGSRNATAMGSQDAQAMAYALSEAGLTIVSGLALGIDAAAHRGGLGGASSSVAVMGTGADIRYPRRNALLAEQLAAEGCVVTEFPLGSPSVPANFPRRNRLISGLSRGVLVVEAALGSGSLITAKYALEQGRDVFAVPGSIHATLSKGCHWLIKEGAKLVESADDILLDLRMSSVVSTAQQQLDKPPSRDPLLDVMGYAPMSFDDFAMHTGLGAATLAAQLTKLELEGCIEVLPGGRFQRTQRREIE
jgi:DNA processing protein